MRRAIPRTNTAVVDGERGRVGDMETVWVVFILNHFRPSQCEHNEEKKLSGTISL